MDATIIYALINSFVINKSCCQFKSYSDKTKVFFTINLMTILKTIMYNNFTVV